MKTVQYDGPAHVLQVGDVLIPRGVPTVVEDDIADAVAHKVQVVDDAAGDDGGDS